MYYVLVLIVFVVGFQYRSQMFNLVQPIVFVCFHCCFVKTLSQVKEGLVLRTWFDHDTYLMCISQARNLLSSGYRCLNSRLLLFVHYLSIDDVDCRVYE